MSAAVPIIAIIVVWLFVLAPWIMRSQRPMSHTGEAFDDTRVLFEGDSGSVQGRRRPRLDKADVRSYDEEDDYEVVTVEDEPVAEHRTTIAEAAARVKAHPRGVPGTDSVNLIGAAGTEVTQADGTIDGELVEDLGEGAVLGEATPAAEHTTAAAEVAQDKSDATFSRVADAHAAVAASKPDADAAIDDEDDEDDLLIEDETPEVPDATDSAAEELSVAADESEVFTAPAVREVAEDAYDFDETFTSPVDLMYPGAVDAEEEQVAAQTDAAVSAAGELDTDSVEGEDTDLSADEVAFAQRRLGRGGWDPVAEKAASATRFQRRQRTLIGLAVAVTLTVALGIVAGGWTWWIAGIVGVMTTVYLVALRSQVRQEQELMRRRVHHLRRARLGVRNAEDAALAIPRNLRRPGAVVLEVDDESPDFVHLPVRDEDGGFDDFDGPHASNRQRRDDLASRRVG